MEGPSNRSAAFRIFGTELALLLCWTVVSGLIVFYLVTAKGLLPWDAAPSYIDFATVMRSLNYHGEFLWWAPHLNFGTPTYLAAILASPNFINPIFAGAGACAWILGFFGVYLDLGPVWFSSYLIYYQAFFYLAGIYFLSKQVFQDPKVRLFITLLAAFSAPRLQNLTDIFCLEPATWLVFLVLGFLWFYRSESRTAFWGAAVAAIGFGLSFDLAFLFFNIFFIPILLVAIFCSPQAQQKILSDRIQKHWRAWGALILLVLIAMLPLGMAAGELKDMVPLRKGAYALDQIKAGNPLELFLTSIPGLQLVWTEGYHSHAFINNLGITLTKNQEYVSHHYLGILCLPLVIVGFLHGRSPVRSYLSALLILLFSVLALNATSPLLAHFFYPDHSPFRAVNHIGDSISKMGGSLTILFTAALGLEALIKDPRAVRRTFYAAFFFSLVVGLLFYASFLRSGVFADTRFGLYVFLYFVFALLLILYLSVQAFDVEKEHVLVLILAVMLIDVGTHALINTRQMLGHKNWKEEPPNWVTNPDWGPKDGALKKTSYFEVAINIKTYDRLTLYRVPVEELPEAALYQRVRLSDKIPNKRDTSRWKEVLEIDPSSTDEKTLAEFNALNDAPPASAAPPQVRHYWKTFNRLSASVEAPARSALFLRDAYSPYWQATVNGKKTPLVRAFHNFKALLVPEGKSVVELHFNPVKIKAVILLNYLLWIFAGINFIRQGWRFS